MGVMGKYGERESKGVERDRGDEKIVEIIYNKVSKSELHAERMTAWHEERKMELRSLNIMQL